MFISQVTFSAEKGSEEMLKHIMKKKIGSASASEGNLVSECWYSSDDSTDNYTFVSKWESKEAFKAWMAKNHTGGHSRKEGEDTGNRPKLKKSGCQYVLVEDL